ncbi:MAG: MBOAT family protein [Agathobacter sp.]|nr:MBOAT family protein [Agathobacter sp.]
MSYHLMDYFVLFLPVVLLIYQLVPQKGRPVVLLLANYVFFYMVSGPLVAYILLSTIFTHYIGLWLENVSLTAEVEGKALIMKKRKVLLFGIAISLGILGVLKYFNFFGQTVADVLALFQVNFVYEPIRFMVPIGISFYTLQMISYITDVYRGTQKAEHNLLKIALYLSFFPTIMEGPICRYAQVGEELYAGRSITFENLKFGYQRIVWGLFKKIVIADRLYATVSHVFDNYRDLDGSVIAFGVVCYTVQLYMEFSGCMDIIIASGEIFGVKLPENFRQPFAAKDASEFWRRWHITLGTFFKDYIFYSISLAKPVKNLAKKVKEKLGRNVSKFVGPTIALFGVWSCNGLWHGANWTFIFYGMYYFVLIFIENITEEPVQKLAQKWNINRESSGYRMFQAIKMFFIINIGELFFRANTLQDGFAMLGKTVTDFHISELLGTLSSLKMDTADLVVVAIGIVVVAIVGSLHEREIKIREEIAKSALPVRWGVWYAAILVVIMLGAYGTGYSIVEMIYAGY